MELPRQPTDLPQARRYERVFEAPRTKAFTEGEIITIEIPPINHTYLSKNNKLYFDFTLKYKEASQQTLASIYGDMINTMPLKAGSLTEWETPIENTVYDANYHWPNSYFSREFVNTNITTNIANAFVKPFPSFDINGPYGLINRIRVYDFLGTTLLEDVQGHDVLTAMLADFDMKDDNFTMNRPWVSDQTNTTTPPRTRKFPCSLIRPDDLEKLQNSFTLDQYEGIFNAGLDMLGVIIVPGTVTVTNTFALDLYSFMGKLSDKFVPLHNGFRIELTVNKALIPISFSTAFGDLTVRYYNANDTYRTATLDPFIESMTLSNVYLKADLLEVSPDLDKNVDKVVHYQGFKYQQDFFPYPDFTKVNISDETRPDFTKKINPPLLSLNKVIVGQRYAVNDVYRQKLSWRMKNYLSSLKLLYNKAIVASVSNVTETSQQAIQSFGTPIDYYLTMDDFNVEEPDINLTTKGVQFPIFTFNQYAALEAYLATYAPSSARWFPVNEFQKELTNFEQGKFMVVFNTRLPGTTGDTVGGINTNKASLEYQLSSSSDVCWKSFIDVFLQHDALLKVDPGKSTTVSF
jgi:hypothetical protein